MIVPGTILFLFSAQTTRTADTESRSLLEMSVFSQLHPDASGVNNGDTHDVTLGIYIGEEEIYFAQTNVAVDTGVSTSAAVRRHDIFTLINLMYMYQYV